MARAMKAVQNKNQLSGSENPLPDDFVMVTAHVAPKFCIKYCWFLIRCQSYSNALPYHDGWMTTWNSLLH